LFLMNRGGHCRCWLDTRGDWTRAASAGRTTWSGLGGGARSGTTRHPAPVGPHAARTTLLRVLGRVRPAAWRQQVQGNGYRLSVACRCTRPAVDGQPYDVHRKFEARRPECALQRSAASVRWEVRDGQKPASTNVGSREPCPGCRLASAPAWPVPRPTSRPVRAAPASKARPLRLRPTAGWMRSRDQLLEFGLKLPVYCAGIVTSGRFSGLPVSA
jgi:hypothetical protein